MLVLSRAEAVERALSRLIACFHEQLTAVEIAILERMHDGSDPDRIRSSYWELWTAIADAQDAASGAVRSARAEVGRLVADAYGSGLTASDIWRVGRVTTGVRAELSRAFGVSCEGGTLARLVATLGECLAEDRGHGENGDSGSFADHVTRQVEPAKADALAALRDLALALAARASGDGGRAPASATARGPR